MLDLTVLDVTDVDPGGPARLALERVDPNPAHARANLNYSLSRSVQVQLAIFGVDGRRVRVLVDGVEGAGSHARTWDGMTERGEAVRPGAYLARMEAEGRVMVQRFVWLRFARGRWCVGARSIMIPPLRPARTPKTTARSHDGASSDPTPAHQ